jgi:HSP20 family protein
MAAEEVWMMRHTGSESNRLTAYAVSPRTDLVETPDNFLLFMDLPGVPKDQVRVRMKDEMLTVTGVPLLDQAEERTMLRREFEHAAFHRHIRLSSDRVDIGGISAHLKNGVLSVTIPKQPTGRSRRRRIPVRRVQ